ncbi:response regulator transcription factor [Kyrpidia spormannii]|uniref:DNA-binding response regulator in two-component regulatory system with BaeS n=1 Tax=Kyrpidia spormannii TaxID=2055160 RepID=A0ACA8ZC71_9BACL|nr:response regulator transcription factor [Kyrpidia spormannii]CAB3391601.1 DNA-binding response regulator in two-component regulatory system with BaeS [Kyrpidia spormannii]HHY67371.1 response regulator transcription factor [Alicyclobacillus sp.]
MEATLLLVDDEPRVLDVMATFLQGEGFRIVTAQTGREALEVFQKHQPDLVVLDWMLPEMSGLDVCRELRRMGSVGIIMVTARTEEADKIVGLEVGADDYITKPFSLRELAARIRSVLRRTQGGGDEPSVLRRGDLTIDETKFRVWKGDQEIVLTPTEFKILVTLASRPGTVYSRLQLLQSALGESYLNYERTVDTHVSHLRKKIEDDPAEPRYIQTVYGVGYRFGERL